MEKLWVDRWCEEPEFFGGLVVPQCSGDQLAPARCAELAVQIFDMVMYSVG